MNRVSFILISGLLAGCVGLRWSSLETRLPAPTAPVQKATVSYTLKVPADTLFRGPGDEHVKQQLVPFDDEATPTELAQALLDSGYFNQVHAATEGGDLHLDVELNIKKDSFPPYSSYSLAILPWWGKFGYSVKASVRLADGQTKNYDLSEKMTVVFWLPTLVFSPFLNPNSMERRIRRDLYQALVVKLVQDGILPVSRSGG